MPIKAVAPRRLYRQIAEQIQALIGSGEVAPGSRLPSERELAQQLGVSRPSLREALIALELEGLLEVRVGSGIYVTKPGERRTGHRLPRGETGPVELIRARKLIEGESASLAAKHASRAQIAAIRRALAEMVRESRRGNNPLHADRVFHVRVAEATGNSALARVVETLWDLRTGTFFRRLEHLHFEPPMAADAIAEHRAIAKAIAAREPRGARAAMRRHMDRTYRRYFKD